MTGHHWLDALIAFYLVIIFFAAISIGKDA